MTGGDQNKIVTVVRLHVGIDDTLVLSIRTSGMAAACRCDVNSNVAGGLNASRADTMVQYMCVCARGPIIRPSLALDYWALIVGVDLKLPQVNPEACDEYYRQCAKSQS